MVLGALISGAASFFSKAAPAIIGAGKAIFNAVKPHIPGAIKWVAGKGVDALKGLAQDNANSGGVLRMPDYDELSAATGLAK